MGPQHVRCGMNLLAGRDTAYTRLQWGRNMFVAECATLHILNLLVITFNGAATCSLRNVRDNPDEPWPWGTLQWGRNMFVAECRLPERRA